MYMLNQSQLITQIRLCCLNKRKAQKTIYYEFFDRARELCSSFAADSQELITLLNEGFLNVYKHIQKFRAAGQDVHACFTEWFDKMIICAVVSYYKKMLKIAVFLQTEMKALSAICESKEEKMWLQSAYFRQQYERLSAPNRLIIHLYCKYDFRADELSVALDISETIARKLLSEALCKVKLLFASPHNQKYSESVGSHEMI